MTLRLTTRPTHDRLRGSQDAPRWPDVGLGLGALLLGSSVLVGACALDFDSSRGNVTTSVDNPPLTARCGVDVALVLDASASVRNYNNPPDGNGAVDLVAGAARAFLDGFAGTNSRIAVASYNASPITQLALTDVSASSVTPGGAHDRAIGDAGGLTGPIPRTTGYSEHARVGSGTNWEAGLATAQSLMDDARPGVPRVVVHVTDGVPTRHLNADGSVSDEGDTQQHVDQAAEVADAIKAQGIHIYTVGIGRATSSYISNLQAVSGPDVYDQSNPAAIFDPSSADVILAHDFDDLEALLSGIASGLCASSLTITKLASTLEAPDTYLPAAAWTFVARPGAISGFDWVLPSAAASDEKTVMSDDNGRAQFQWAVRDERAWGDGLIAITEVQEPGFELQPEVACTRARGASEPEAFTVAADPSTGALQVPVGPGEAVACEIHNRAVAAGGCDAPPVVIVRPLVELWPPNHKYHIVTLADCVDSATDGCGNPIDDVNGAGEIVSVYSDEPDNDTGDGNTVNDIEILDSSTVRVRAERRGNHDGRVYGIEFTVTDESGNTTTALCLAGVPHDQSGDPPVDSSASE
jgi:hypothetical protein